MPDLTLNDDEIREITGGYKRPTEQLEILRARGFFRAEIRRGRVLLERSHYDAVCRGQFGGGASKPESRPMLKSQRRKVAA